ncbi:hypothetical protein PIB30_018198 [Stylosanthes scabra]|uniref:Uncharacterized protein n=1 Tax=Stylosanthes scabra TaxID=79078 RepID=A0ABU6T8N5_9FABA|nr:hypothetical protein [Stylosanthes scabra]
MARGDVNVKPTDVPEDMDWIDDLVLLPKSVMDEELIASFRDSHAICGTVSEESQYELVPPNLEERLRAVEGVRPFYENERGEYQFRLYWYSGPESPRLDFDDLDETDQEIVTVLS